MLRNALAILISEALNGQNNPKTKESLLSVILEYMAENEEETYEFDSVEIAGKILRYIQENYRTVTLSDTAKHFNYSEPYLSKMIKDIIGVSFANILQEVKLKEACHLLATTDISMNEISSMIGYKSQVYFSRVFKRKLGVTPFEYRRMHKDKIYFFEGIDILKEEY